MLTTNIQYAVQSSPLTNCFLSTHTSQNLFLLNFYPMSLLKLCLSDKRPKNLSARSRRTNIADVGTTLQETRETQG